MSGCRIFPPADCSMNWLADLHLLYRPICGIQAALIYEDLMIVCRDCASVEWDDLLAFCGCSQPLFDAGIRKLEELSLIRIYQQPSPSAGFEEQFDEQFGTRQVDGDSIFELLPPKSQMQFLEDPLLSRLFFEAQGKEGLERLYRMRPVRTIEGTLRKPPRVQAQHLETTWTQSKEADLRSSTGDWHNVEAYPFDWSRFFKGMHHAIPQRLRSRENMSRIAHLAGLYGLDEDAMRTIVLRHCRDRKSWIDFDGMVSALEHTSKITAGAPEDYLQSPITFLGAHQPADAIILPDERRLLAELAEKKNLSNDVINTLTEYCLKQNSGSFSVKYMRTLANNMIRARADTRDKVLAQLEQGTKSRKNRKPKDTGQTLPDWYSNVSEEKATQEEVDAVLDLQRRILERVKEGGNDGEN